MTKQWGSNITNNLMHEGIGQPHVLELYRQHYRGDILDFQSGLRQYLHVMKQLNVPDEIFEYQSRVVEMLPAYQALLLKSSDALTSHSESSLKQFETSTQSEISKNNGMSEWYSQNIGWSQVEDFAESIASIFSSKYEADPGREASDRRKINQLEEDIRKLKKALDEATASHNKDMKIVRTNYAVGMFDSAVTLAQAAHGRRIHQDISKYCGNQKCTLNELVLQFENDPPIFNPLMSLLKGNWVESDIQSLVEYGETAEITMRPEQRALLQFINHSLLPHIDYFEIWASKMQDLEIARVDIEDAFKSYIPEARPKLEILAETAISLSGKRDVSPRSTLKHQLDEIQQKIRTAEESYNYAQKTELLVQEQAVKNSLSLLSEPVGKGEMAALSQGLAWQDSAQNSVKALVADLRNPALGSLEVRQRMIKERAADNIKQYNAFFAGVDGALKKIDSELDRQISKRDKSRFAYERAESIENQLAILNFNTPDALAEHEKDILTGSVGARSVLNMLVGSAVGGAAFAGPLGAAAGAGVAVAGAIQEVLVGNVRIDKVKLRRQVEQDIRMKSLLARRRVDPAVELKEVLDGLDNEVEKLTHNQEFLNFLQHHGALENIQSTFMVLPRISAGAINTKALTRKMKQFGYEDLDIFLSELNTSNARLGVAMENFVYGFADTNDLNLIVTAANRLHEPKSASERLLVEFVEKIVKEHYNDYVRQASIVDELTARNVLYTGHPFHSFGEIVKRETDAALRTLLAGKGEFSLVGSNTVHQIFDHYASRYGEESYADLFKRNQYTSKGCETVLPHVLKARIKQEIRSKMPESLIPRVTEGKIFLDICQHEYLLSQGFNIVKDGFWKNTPHACAALEMVNTTTDKFLENLALHKAWQARGGNGEPKRLHPLLEGLIADTFISFYSELGALHANNAEIQEACSDVKEAYRGENFPTSNLIYSETIMDDAANHFDLFLKIYRRSLETKLTSCSRENRKLLEQEILSVKDIMKDIQISEDITLPESEEAWLNAQFRNHTLKNVGITHDTWVRRTNAIEGQQKHKSV